MQNVDLPTGLRRDGTLDAEVFRADLTVTMGALKRGMFSDAAKNVVGEIVAVRAALLRSTANRFMRWSPIFPA